MMGWHLPLRMSAVTPSCCAGRVAGLESVKMGAVVDRFGAICSAEYETDILLPPVLSSGVEEEYNPAGAGSAEPTKHRVMMSDCRRTAQRRAVAVGARWRASRVSPPPQTAQALAAHRRPTA